MADDRTDPRDHIPDADLLEQQTPLDPALTESELDAFVDTSAQSVDEADLIEQHLSVPLSEDDYPRVLDQAGWS